VFDLMRACAAMLVFLFHYNSFAGPETHGSLWIDDGEWLVSRLGSLGTNLLLLLSGYFIGHSLAGKGFSYGRFVASRLTRIYVPYVVVLGVAMACSVWAPKLARVPLASWSWRLFGEQLLLWPGLFPAHPILTVTWTLSYIVAGYVLLPLVWVGLNRQTLSPRARLEVWSILVGFCFGIAAVGLIPTRFTYIPAGCMIFELQTRTFARFGNRMPLGLFGIGAVALVARVLLDGRIVQIPDPDVFRSFHMGSGLLTVSTLLAGGLLLQHRYQVLEQIPGLWLAAGFGRTGYSFYLLHGPVVKIFAILVFPQMAKAAAPAAAYWLVMPASFALAALAGLLLYRKVEVPCRRLLSDRTASGEARRTIERQVALLAGAVSRSRGVSVEKPEALSARPAVPADGGTAPAPEHPDAPRLSPRG